MSETIETPKSPVVKTTKTPTVQPSLGSAPEGVGGDDERDNSQESDGLVSDEWIDGGGGGGGGGGDNKTQASGSEAKAIDDGETGSDEAEQDADHTPEQASPLTSKKEAQVRQDVYQALEDWGVNPNQVKTFEKLSKDLEIPQLLDAAVSLFPEINKLLEISQKLSDEDRAEEIGKEASFQIAKITEMMGLSLSESEQKLATFAWSIVSGGGQELAKWFGKSWENSDLERLLDAIVQAANYNSRTTLSRLESEAGENAVSSNDFFKKIHYEGITKLLDNDVAKELDNLLNWGEGEQLLNKARKKNEEEQHQALETYLTIMYERVASGSAPHLMREKASQLLAKKLFSKDILAGAVWTDLKKMKDGEIDLQQLSK